MAKKAKNSRKALTGKTLNQTTLISSINKYPTIIVTGPAGTGKTFIAASRAAEMLLEGVVAKIVITRPTVPTGRSIGFFPGSLEEKMAPWTIPVMDVLKAVLGQGKFECDIKNGNIEVVPFETIRGRSFNNAFVILDEAQNATFEELKAFLTRSGEDTTTVINGDISQTDLNGYSGLSRVVSLVESYGPLKGIVPVIQFTNEDIVRSGICKLFVEAFNFEDQKKEAEELKKMLNGHAPLSKRKEWFGTLE